MLKNIHIKSIFFTFQSRATYQEINRRQTDRHTVICLMSVSKMHMTKSSINRRRKIEIWKTTENVN